MIEVWTIYVAPHHFTSPVTNWRDLRAICIKQAAAFLSSTPWAVRNLIWDRKIPYILLGKKQLIDRADLDRFIEAQKQRAGDAFYGSQAAKASKRRKKPCLRAVQ